MKTNHLVNESLIGYVNRTIDDAKRESIDAHLLICPTCRGRLKRQELQQHRLLNELNAAINSLSASKQMNFTGIAPRLQTRHTTLKLWPQLSVSAPIALALVGLLLSLLGLWQFINVRSLSPPSQQIGIFPTLACFIFMLASVEQFDQVFSIRPRFAITVFVTVILWLGTAFIGLLNLIVIRDLTIMAIVSLGGTAAAASPIAILAIMGGAMFYIGAVIGGAEHHFRNIGQPSSWKIFSITLLGQLFILILPYLIF